MWWHRTLPLPPRPTPGSDSWVHVLWYLNFPAEFLIYSVLLAELNEADFLFCLKILTFNSCFGEVSAADSKSWCHRRRSWLACLLYCSQFLYQLTSSQFKFALWHVSTQEQACLSAASIGQTTPIFTPFIHLLCDNAGLRLSLDLWPCCHSSQRASKHQRRTTKAKAEAAAIQTQPVFCVLHAGRVYVCVHALVCYVSSVFPDSRGASW